MQQLKSTCTKLEWALFCASSTETKIHHVNLHECRSSAVKRKGSNSPLWAWMSTRNVSRTTTHDAEVIKFYDMNINLAFKVMFKPTVLSYLMGSCPKQLDCRGPHSTFFRTSSYLHFGKCISLLHVPISISQKVLIFRARDFQEKFTLNNRSRSGNRVSDTE